MPELPTSLYRPADVAELDRTAIEAFGIDGYELMGRAGQAAYNALRAQWPEGQRLLVLCGGGNNGGDGYVIARLAAEAGLDVRLIALSDPAKLQGSAARAATDCREWVEPEAFDAEALDDTDLVVDALLGTGLDRPVAGRYAEAIEAVNAASAAVVAVDIPSGISGDTGAVMGTAIRAHLTVTFIGLKRGLLTGAAPAHTGRLVFEALDVPAPVYEAVTASAWRVSRTDASEALAPRPRDAHKGAYGHVLVVGGDRGMGGAARLAGEAAARVGAGLTSVGTRQEHLAAVLAGRPECMVVPVEANADLEEPLQRATVAALGPGLGQGDWGRARFEHLRGWSGPMVMDADALNLLAADPDRHEQRVITPHPGEAARLLGWDTATVQADRFAAVEALQARYGGVVVLKGAGTLITDGTHTWLSDTGNPGMASGGMGDVLTGVIAGLLAQGLPTARAAALGVWCHGRAADQASKAGGERGLLAGDLVSRLPAVVNP